MNEFPLSPFFISLSLDGIPVLTDDYERVARVLSTRGDWNRSRLCGALMALLAHDPEQVKIFKRRFDSFFEPEIFESDRITAEQIDFFLEDLRTFEFPEFITPPNPPPERPPETPTELPPEPPTLWQKIRNRLPKKVELKKAFIKFWQFMRRKFSVWYLILGVFLLAITLGLYLSIPTLPTIPEFPYPPKEEVNNASATESPPPTVPQKVNIDELSEPRSVPLTDRTWSDYISSAGLVLFPLGLWLLIVLISSQFVKEQPPHFDEKKPRLFPLNLIGGQISPQIDSATLDHLADSLSYFLSENQGKKLDIEKTVRAVGQNAGFPVLHFEKLKRVRSIYILEDANAEPLAWNPIAGELAEGLRKRGINVNYGKFHGSLEKLQMQEGKAEWLEDINAESEKSLIFFFSDGKSLNTRRDKFLLESLARNSSAAWFDLREKTHWDESAKIIKDHKIPLYQANVAGITRALERFATERGSEKDDTTDIKRWNGKPANVGSDLDMYVESLLGDALAWTQACAMIQPITQGLADKLRLKFLPDLPRERIERLYLLPGSSWNVSGLRFSLPVLAILRRGFTIRWSEDEQRKILEFILEKIRQVEPPEEDSLRHLSWEYSLERVRLELDPDQALERLAQLSLTPFKDHIQTEFDHLIVPGQETSEDAVPLRVRPLTQKGLKQFEKLSGKSIKSNDIWESLRSARYIIFNFFGLFARTVKNIFGQIGKLLKTLSGKTSKHITSGEIYAEPTKLNFRRLRMDKPAKQTLTIHRPDGENLRGRIESEASWLDIQRTLCDGHQTKHKTQITAFAENLAPGQHTAIIKYIPSDETPPLEIETNAFVVRSWADSLAHWWRENKPSKAMRFALGSFILGFIMVGLAEYTLPRNWSNTLFNTPPQVVGFEHERLSDGEQMRLEAKVKDADGDTFKHGWERSEIKPTENKEIPKNSDSESNLVPLEIKDSVPVQYLLNETNQDSGTFDLTLRLYDERGGQSIYTTQVSFSKEEIIEKIIIPTDEKEFPDKKAENREATDLKPNDKQPKPSNDEEPSGRKEIIANITVTPQIPPLISVVRLGSLQGKIVDEQGDPISGITVRISNDDDSKTAITDENGYYFISDIFPDKYEIYVDMLQLYDNIREVIEIKTGESKIRNFTDLEPRIKDIPDEQLIRGIVTDEKGIPVKNAQITATQEGNLTDILSPFQSPKTDSKGKYSFSAFPGRYYLYVTHPNFNKYSIRFDVNISSNPEMLIRLKPKEEDRDAKVVSTDNSRYVTRLGDVVKLEVTIDERGKPIGYRTISPVNRDGMVILQKNKSINPNTVFSRVKKNWSFQPAIKDGKPITSKLTIIVNVKVPVTSNE